MGQARVIRRAKRIVLQGQMEEGKFYITNDTKWTPAGRQCEIEEDTLSNIGHQGISLPVGKGREHSLFGTLQKEASA